MRITSGYQMKIQGNSRNSNIIAPVGTKKGTKNGLKGTMEGRDKINRYY